MPYLNANIPVISCLIRNEYLFNHESGHGEFTKCDIHSVASIEKRTPLFEVFLENGVNWTRRPITAFCWKETSPQLQLEEQIYWDCFSYYIDISIRNRLSGLTAELIKPNNNKILGEYLFTLDWAFENSNVINCSFSETPEHKCGHMFKGEDGNFYIYPNNRIIWFDKAFTENRITKNPGYKIDLNQYSVENKKYQETDDLYITNFNGETREKNNNV